MNSFKGFFRDFFQKNLLELFQESLQECFQEFNWELLQNFLWEFIQQFLWEFLKILGSSSQSASRSIFLNFLQELLPKECAKKLPIKMFSLKKKTSEGDSKEITIIFLELLQ